MQPPNFLSFVNSKKTYLEAVHLNESKTNDKCSKSQLTVCPRPGCQQLCHHCLPVFPQAHYQTNHCLFSDPASDLEIVIFKLFREKEGFWKQSTGTLSLLWSCFVLWKNLQVHSYGLKNEKGKSLTDAQVWLLHSCSRYICHASFIQVINTQTYRFRLTSSCSELQENMMLLLSPPAFAFSYPWLWDIELFPIPLHKT